MFAPINVDVLNLNFYLDFPLGKLPVARHGFAEFATIQATFRKFSSSVRIRKTIATQFQLSSIGIGLVGLAQNLQQRRYDLDRLSGVPDAVRQHGRPDRRRMRCAELADEAMGIGSDVVEAANKILVTRWMKRSGMRWRIRSGQAVLSFRVLLKSGLFDRTWSDLMAARDAAANENHPLPNRAIAA